MTLNEFKEKLAEKHAGQFYLQDDRFIRHKTLEIGSYGIEISACPLAAIFGDAYLLGSRERGNVGAGQGCHHGRGRRRKFRAPALDARDALREGGMRPEQGKRDSYVIRRSLELLDEGIPVAQCRNLANTEWKQGCRTVAEGQRFHETTTKEATP